MLSTLRVLRALKQRDSSGRIGALRREGAGHPNGIAPWALAMELWIAGDIVEARALAETILQQEPTDFCSLAICSDYLVRAGNPEGALAYAQRLAVADMPMGFRHGGIAKALLSPLWLIGYGRAVREYSEWVQRWVHWARDYVKANGT